MTDLQTTTASPTALPPVRRPGTVLAVDCDRTLTGDDLVPDERALAAIAQLRAMDVKCVLVTGRTQADLARHHALPHAFDAYALEGGAAWGPWDDLWLPGNVNIVLDAASRLEAAGVAVRRGKASFSCDRADLPRVSALAADCSIQPNVDRVDVLPPGMDKGMGLEAALGRMGLRGVQVIAIGDGENDIPLFGRADVGLALANAHPALKEAADTVLEEAGPLGLVQAAKRILHGEWSLQTRTGAPA